MSEAVFKDFNKFTIKVMDPILKWLAEKYNYHLIVDITLKIENEEGFIKERESRWSYPYIIKEETKDRE